MAFDRICCLFSILTSSPAPYQSSSFPAPVRIEDHIWIESFQGSATFGIRLSYFSQYRYNDFTIMMKAYLEPKEELADAARSFVSFQKNACGMGLGSVKSMIDFGG